MLLEGITYNVFKLQIGHKAAKDEVMSDPEERLGLLRRSLENR